MARTFFPSTDAALLAWSLNFNTLITATPTAYGLTAALAIACGTLHVDYATALAACDPSIRTKSAVVTKNQAKTSLKNDIRLLARLVEGTGSVTDAQKISLGLNVKHTPTPIPAPSSSPGLDVLSVVGWTVSVHLHDLASSAKRGKPPGVIGSSVFSYVGPTPAADIGEWKFEGSTGKSKFDVVFSSTLAPGTKVWLTAFWFNNRKQSGPACAPESTNLQGGLVSMAA